MLFVSVLLLFGSSFVAGQEVIFEDKFEGNLRPGWNWLRANPACQRFGSDGLEIRAEPFAENAARNVLARRVDFLGKGPVRIETRLSCIKRPVQQYQQSGLCWMQNGQVVFKLVYELVDNQLFIFPGKVPIDSDSATLRLTLNGDDLVAEFQAGNESGYRRVYEGKLTGSNDDEISLQCWNGPENDEHWVRFRYFRVYKAED
ncbi:MAG: hypothetical protein Q4G68_01710 [Planctomycetia bacterium]|nr:hypothetical protein [Planctomycetia bacterium]